LVDVPQEETVSVMVEAVDDPVQFAEEYSKTINPELEQFTITLVDS
jgi:hypothetical protein